MFRITIRYLLCSVFKVHFLRFTLSSSAIFNFESNSAFLRETKKFEFLQIGGLKWTRTTDLTLIRRAL